MENRDLVPDYQLDQVGRITWDRCTGIDPHLKLYEHAIRRYEVRLHTWALWWFPWGSTPPAAKDKYVVDEPKTRQDTGGER